MFTCASDVLDFKINYKITKKKRIGLFKLSHVNEETVILNNGNFSQLFSPPVAHEYFVVKGRLESGTLTAILGASGCGKTSLLAALSLRLRDEISGKIEFNGETLNRKKMAQISGFLPQSDVILEGITVREHLHFMIGLKLPYISALEKQHLIYSSLNKFGLNAQTKLMYLSGGEKRKLSLATELLTRPHLLFCDEPSTGLDSFSAYSVVSTLKELAGYSNEPKLFQKPSDSRIVVISIHQPTSDIFHLFTNIILMNAGRIIFHGTVEEAERLFTSINLSCPPCYNPAEFYISIISDPKKSSNVVKCLAMKEDERSQNSTPSSSSLESYGTEKDIHRPLPWIHQCRIISHRATLNFLRAPSHYLIELFILILFSMVIMLVYLKISFESRTSVQDINGYLLMLACEILFTFVYAVFTFIYIELPLLRKETGNRLYSLSAYYVSLVVMMIPRVIFETLIYTAIIYFSVDVGRDFSTFMSISIAIMMSGMCAMSYGFFLSGIFESFFVGTELSGIVDLVLMLASGMYINVNQVKWLKYISFFYYANETVAINFWLKVDEIKCFPEDEGNCLHNGTAVLQHFGYGTSQSDIYKDYIYQFILTIILHVLAFLGIRRNVQSAGFY